jgi:hypothetical protein
MKFMTAFNFVLDPNYVLIFMDTLSLRINKEPFKYASKIFPLPHLRGVLCGTGSLNTIIDWHAYIQLQIISNLMDVPNEIAPSQLKTIHSKYDINGTNEATIYHFGFNPIDGRIKGYAFRSTNEFSLEELEDGIGIKPHDDSIISYLRDRAKDYDGNLENLFIDIVKMQKMIDDDDDPRNRLGIGGSIHMYRLNKNYQFLWECYNFDDYNETYSKMLQGDGIKRIL